MNFVKRHSIRTVSLLGEGDSASAQEVAIVIAELGQKLTDFPMNYIFHADGIGLTFRLLPKKTHIVILGIKKRMNGSRST